MIFGNEIEHERTNIFQTQYYFRLEAGRYDNVAELRGCM